MSNNNLAKSRIRFLAVFLILGILFFVLLIANINAGTVSLSPLRIAQVLLTRKGEANELNIIFKLRLPRVLMAGLLGGALALAGFLLQTFFANPIAGPFVLGISSGSKMLVALTMIYFLDKLGRVSSLAMVGAAFLGAMLSTLFILFVSRQVRAMSGLLVAGIMIGYICNAITDFLVTFAEDSDIVNLRG
ncbi:MAG: iron chelate uptake ABC transporter family permease subunit, partial [Lachnospiraceae bacterium]|nr:iron chelate uptake ABC transporter family permease subunit [Lachnospiraceae bacterium]